MARQFSLRLLGLLAAAVVVAAAAQLLAIGITGTGVLGTRDADTASRWMGRSRGDGVEALVGVGLVALGCWFSFALVTTARTSRSVITTRRASGWTRIDRRHLARSIERALDAEFPEEGIAVRLRRRNRVDVTVTTDDPFPGPRLEDVHEALLQLIADHALPCTVGGIVARAPKRARTSRVQ